MGSINSLVHVFPIQFAMLDLPETCREILFSFRTKHHPFLLEARMARLVVFGLSHYHPGPSPTCDVIVICINCHQRSSCSYSPLEPLQSNPQCCVCLLVAWCLLFVFVDLPVSDISTHHGSTATMRCTASIMPKTCCTQNCCSPKKLTHSWFSV